jgi:hypothetical protein
MTAFIIPSRFYRMGQPAVYSDKALDKIISTIRKFWDDEK